MDHQSIYTRLKDEILHGKHPPGTPLRETSLASRFGVSRTPVREALGRLQHEGLLERGQRGLQVRRVDPEQILQVYDMRIMLEEEAARQAAAARTEMDLVRLDSLLERDRSLSAPDDATRIATNLEFHAAIWTAAHNPVLEDLLERLSTHLVHAPTSTLSVGNRWPESLDEHAGLVEAVRTRDTDNAGLHAKEHMTTARNLRLEMFRHSAGG
ncbi:GntR family transcriptional regulator [Arthrobacter castelli]|uniref:GntR family transcriptional regulator n=1 Tax=Arthrobacter castelli TaxID=271431 RepID=UPI0003FB11E8|nr:GntR family transcriptional regulator [Arthrobacter castelli]